MTEFTIIVDSREKKPYSFNRYPIETVDATLETGDYAVEGDGNATGERTFDPHFAVERKEETDFLNSITWTRDRFEDELGRADSFAHRMPVVVEKPWSYFENESYYPDVNVNSIKATIDCHPDMYRMDYFFARGRTKAEQLTYEWLKWRASTLAERHE